MMWLELSMSTRGSRDATAAVASTIQFWWPFLHSVEILTAFSIENMRR